MAVLLGITKRDRPVLIPTSDFHADFIDRGCGFMTMHFSTFVTDEQGKSVLNWNGGYFDWQDDAGKANWFAFSGSKGDRIFYEKVISACKGEAANHVRIEYPSPRKSEFDPIVAHGRNRENVDLSCPQFLQQLSGFFVAPH